MDPKQVIGDYLRDQLKASGLIRAEVVRRCADVGVTLTVQRLRGLESTKRGPARVLPAVHELLALAEVYEADAAQRWELLAALACVGPDDLRGWLAVSRV